jgi:hypothetical protein
VQQRCWAVRITGSGNSNKTQFRRPRHRSVWTALSLSSHRLVVSQKKSRNLCTGGPPKLVDAAAVERPVLRQT